MEFTNLNIRTDKEVKLQAEKIFNSLGFNMTTAVNIFLRQVIRENGIPFDVRIKLPHENHTSGTAWSYSGDTTDYPYISNVIEELDV